MKVNKNLPPLHLITRILITMLFYNTACSKEHMGGVFKVTLSSQKIK